VIRGNNAIKEPGLTELLVLKGMPHEEQVASAMKRQGIMSIFIVF
jgi:hypothetical protein